MTAKHVALTLREDLETKEINVATEGPISFPIALHLTLTGIKTLKDQLIKQTEEASFEALKKFVALPEGNTTDETTLRAQILEQMEGEMYDLLNFSVSNFLDVEFPRVNSAPSLTEQAATTAGLSRDATREEILEAENNYIENFPEEAALTKELQPTEVKKIDIN